MNRGTILRSSVFTALLSLVFAGGADATVRLSGPTRDFKGDVVAVQVPNGNGFVTTETWTVYWGSPYNPYATPPLVGLPFTRAPGFYNPIFGTPYGFLTSTFNDFIGVGNLPNLNNDPARFIAAAAYIAYDDSTTGSQTIYTVYGHDANPTDPNTLSITGFDSAGVVPTFSGEQIFGMDGITYSGAGQLTPISALSSILGSSADLSIFSGDPSRQVYVATTTVPFAAAVPEPASMSLMAMGAVALVTHRQRRKAN